MLSPMSQTGGRTIGRPDPLDHHWHGDSDRRLSGQIQSGPLANQNDFRLLGARESRLELLHSRDGCV